jgi:hypothetical protein
MKPGDLRIAHNIDFGANLGAITIRRGYDSVSTIAGMDSILGIYAAYYRDGSQQLFIVADSAGVGYGNIYITQKGSVNIADAPDSLTRIWQYWGVQSKPSFSQHADNVYIVNSQQKGIVWNGKIARTWPPLAPGEPLIIPLNDTASTGYGLDGSYRYVLTIDSLPSGSSTKDARTYLSSPINIKNGKVLITDLSWPRDDSMTTLDTSVTADSIRYVLYRTKGDFGQLDRSDSMWILTDTRTTVANYGALAGLVIIDSTADTSLTTGKVIIVDSLLGRDSTGVLRSYIGAPGYVSMDTTPSYSQARTDSAELYGIFHGVPSAGLGDTMGIAYACTFIDTLTGWESDTGRSLIVWVDSLASGVGNPPYSITIKLPNVPSGSTGLIKNLYRANLMKINSGAKFSVLDSAETVRLEQLLMILRACGGIYTDETIYLREGDRTICFTIQEEYRRFIKEHNISYSDSRRWRKLVPVDSILLDDFILLAQFVDTQSTYGDSVRYDSLAATGEVYLKGSLNRPPTQIFSFEDRLWSVDGSNLWKSSLLSSVLDTVPFFTQVPAITLNRDDGDQITLTFSARGVIRVFKNFSNHNVYQNANLEWARSEVSGTFGCIAPNSYAKGFSGHYYLSDAGVVRENEGANLERTQSIELISAPIKSFDQMSLIDKSAAIGFYDDRKFLLYVPAAGTTYVYDERASDHVGYPVWSTWDLVFQGATKYGVETELGFFPGDTMYYFNGNILYLLGVDVAFNLDVTPDPVVVTWQTGPLFPDGRRQSISKIGAWIRQDAGHYIVKIAVIDESGTVSDSVAFNFISDPGERYVVRGVGVNNGVFLLLGGTNQVAIANVVPSIIDGIDIWYTDESPVIVE